MSSDFMRKKVLPLFAALVAWLSLTLLAWQAWMPGLTSVRFGLAVLLFVTPGALSLALLRDEQPVNWRKLLLGGVALSIFATGLLGAVARLLSLNFAFIRGGIVLWGAVMITTVFLTDTKIPIQVNKPARWEAMVLLVTAGMAVFIAWMAKPPLMHDDAFAYNALLYYFQHAPVLDFRLPEALNGLEIPRFWIAFWPLTEAVLSELAGVDGILVSGIYLPPVLALFSFLGVYSLGRGLGLNCAGASVAVLAQGMSLLRLTRLNQPGYQFFQLLTEDKMVAAFVLSPILILAAAEYLDLPRPRRLLLTGLIALAVAFIHPIMLGMIGLFIGVYGLPLLWSRSARGAFLLLMAVLLSVILIPYTLRFGSSEDPQKLSFSLDEVIANDDLGHFGIRRVDYIAGTPFYGISYYLTRGLPYEVDFAAAALSLFLFSRNKLARFVLAACLALGFAMLPYTGWLLGSLTTPFMLWRLTWLTPFGMAFALFFQTGEQALTRSLARSSGLSPALLPPLAAVCACLALVSGILYVRPWATENLGRSARDLEAIYVDYIDLGGAMNGMAVEGPLIVGGPNAITNSIIPSLTLRFTPLVFRVQTNGGGAVLWKSIFAEDVPLPERYQRILSHDVEYLLIKGRLDWVQELVESSRLELVYRNQRLSLYRLTDLH